MPEGAIIEVKSSPKLTELLIARGSGPPPDCASLLALGGPVDPWENFQIWLQHVTQHFGKSQNHSWKGPLEIT